MDRFEKMVQSLANDNTVPEQVWTKYTDALQNLPEKGTAKAPAAAGTSSISAYPSRRTGSLNQLKYAAVLAASLCLVAGTAYAANMSGLFDYLSGFMGQSDVEDGLLGEPAEVTAQQEEAGSYGNLWNITDTWYDGAKVYFYAETPEAVLEDGKLKVIHKDHMTVNGVDHLLNSEEQSDGVYLCWVDVSDIDDTETLELSIRLELLQNQYDWTVYPAVIVDGIEYEYDYDYATDVTVAEEQTLTFTVGGKRIGHDVDFPESLGAIIETPGFLSDLSGRRNLEILADLRGRIGRKEITSVLMRVGLDPNLKKPVAKYSLGMRQRLGIAQAIMEDPELLILDEPFNGLDRHGVAEIRQLLLIEKQKGKTILLASHNSEDIRILCDRVFEMDAGVMREVTEGKAK